MKVRVNGFTRTFPGVISEILTECGVSLPHDPNSGTQHPQIINTVGLWDTGATNSVITKSLAAKLALKPIRTIQSHHAGGSSIVNVYLINIFLPNNVGIPYVQVSECVDTIGRFGILIGMDVFCRGDFAMSHVGRQTTISFRMPSIHPIRLEKDCMPDNVLSKNVNPIKSVKKGTNTIDPNTSRNAPCPCGSGKKYKHCHGK